MERKQTCPALQHSRKIQLPVLNMNGIDQNKPCFTASSIGTTQSFLLTCRNRAGLCPIMYKKNLMNFQNAVGWNMVSCECNAGLATREG